MRKAIAFVAIAWAVAATFVLFEIAALSATSLIFLFPDSFGTFFLPREITQSTTCVLSADERGLAHAAGASSPALTASWLLGLGVGRDAVVRQLTTDQELLDASAKDLEDFARGLGAPAPALFAPRQVANANREFVSFIEADDRKTAHDLAVKHSPRACQLYKLGAVWGYSTMERPMLAGERAVFAAEIRYYAREVGLPDALWEPMIDRTPPNATREQLLADTNALTRAVTSHLMAQR